mmetsp:Transcript_21113/g.24488  ORF Transcript_21113/g.24488 Transcript_21113/m.24488 type:complete len:135 (+) Transcript_21113:82-486(+)
MSDKHYDRVVLRVRKFLTNRLLSRRQMIVDAVHPNVPNVPKDKMREILAKKYKTDIKNISVFGFKTQFGGGRSTGFAFIYDNEEYLKKYEPKYRLRRLKLLPERIGNRKGRKELKNKKKKVRGKAKSKVVGGKK